MKKQILPLKTEPPTIEKQKPLVRKMSSQVKISRKAKEQGKQQLILITATISLTLNKTNDNSVAQNNISFHVKCCKTKTTMSNNDISYFEQDNDNSVVQNNKK